MEYKNGTLTENPITESYINSLESILPRQERRKLFSITGNMTVQERFDQISNAFTNLQKFAFSELIKYGSAKNLPISVEQKNVDFSKPPPRIFMKFN